MRDTLPYRVQCRSIFPFFETIAAFDCEFAALVYATECKAANGRNDYRVTTRGKVHTCENAVAIAARASRNP